MNELEFILNDITVLKGCSVVEARQAAEKLQNSDRRITELQSAAAYLRLSLEIKQGKNLWRWKSFAPRV